MAEESLLLEQQGGIAWLTLNRPQVHNAINLELRDALWAALDAVSLDPDVGVLVFRGAGERAFSAGADLADFGTASSFTEARRGRRERDLWGRLAFFEKPMIAAVQGFALGAGCELSLYCDLRIAAPEARFGLPEVSLGYLPTAGGSQTLPRIAGLGRALHMICSGVAVPAQQALEYGIIHEVVPRDQLYARAEALAQRLLAQPAEVLKATKAAVLQGLDMSLETGLRFEAAQRSSPSHLPR